MDYWSRLFAFIPLVLIAAQVGAAGITWVSGSYPTVWESEANYLVEDGDMLYLHHVHNESGHIALYYFLVRVSQEGHPSSIFAYLGYDWTNNKYAIFKGQRSTGTRSAEVQDGSFVSIEEYKYDRWDHSQSKDLGWQEGKDWDTVAVGNTGWSAEEVMGVMMEINNSRNVTSKVNVYRLQDYKTGEHNTGNPHDENTDAGNEIGGGDQGSGGDTGNGGDTGSGGDGGTVINEGDVTVNVDVEGITQEELQGILGYGEYGTNAPPVEVQTIDVNVNNPGHQVSSEQDMEKEYPHFDRFVAVVERARNALDVNQGGGPENEHFTLQATQDHEIDFEIPLGYDSPHANLIGMARNIAIAFIFFGTAVGLLNIFKRLFE